MNHHLNFIKPVPTAKNRELRLWAWTCFIVTLVTVSTIAIVTGMQWYLYRSLHEQKQLLDAQLSQFSMIKATYNKQQQEQQLLQKQLDTLLRNKNNPKNPRDVFIILRNAIKGITLQSASIRTKQFMVQIVCSSAAPIITCIKYLNQQPGISNIMLDSLETHQDKVQATITGNITTKLRTIS